MSTTEQQYCYYQGLIRYYEPALQGFGFVSTNKEYKGVPISNKDIPIIGTLDEVQSYNKALISK